MPSYVKIAARSYRRFIPPPDRIVEREAFGSTEWGAIYAAERAIICARFELESDSSRGSRLAYPRVDAQFFLIGDRQDMINRCLVAIDTASGETIGGVSKFTPFVHEKHRGRGIGRDFHLVADAHDLEIFFPGKFSIEGYRARMAAHRVAVADAVAEGRPVHPDNLTHYAELLERRCEDTLAP